MLVDRSRGREVVYGFGELEELVLAYATTIHNSQGSEYPAVVIPLSTQYYPMLQRNLVRRGKRLVLLVSRGESPHRGPLGPIARGAPDRP